MKVCFECGQYTSSATVNKQGQTMNDPIDCDHKTYIYADRKFNAKNLADELEHVESKPLAEVENQ